MPAAPTVRADRMRRILLWLATGVAVFTAMFDSFWYPDQTLPMGNIQFEVHGFGIVLLCLAPALIAALPNFASPRARTAFTLAVEIILSVVSFTIPLPSRPTKKVVCPPWSGGHTTALCHGTADTAIR